MKEGLPIADVIERARQGEEFIYDRVYYSGEYKWDVLSFDEESGLWVTNELTGSCSRPRSSDFKDNIWVPKDDSFNTNFEITNTEWLMDVLQFVWFECRASRHGRTELPRKKRKGA